jgi:MFS family permease
MRGTKMKNIKKWLNKNLIGFGLTSFFSDFCFEMTTPILPLFIEQLAGPAYGPLALGFIEGFANGFAACTRIIAGRIADKVKFYKPYLIAGYGVMPIFISLIGTASSVWLVALYKSIAWIFRAMREPIRDTWISKIIDPHYYGRAFGFHRALDSGGAVVGPLITFFIFKNVELPTIFYLALIPGLLSVSSLILLTHEKKEGERANLKLTPFVKTTKMLPRNFIQFLFIMLLFGLGNFNQTLLIYRAQEVFIGKADSFLIASGWSILFYVFFNIIRSMSEFSIGSLSDFINREKLLAILGFGAFGVTSLCFMVETTQALFWFLFFAIAGLSTGTVKALEKAHAATLLPENIRGTGLGILQAIDGVGDFASSAIVGALWSWWSPIAGFAYAALLSFAAMIVFLLKK